MRGPVTVGWLCRKLGMSRQYYYQERRERQRWRREADEGLIEQLVRAEQPQLGGRKLFHMLGPELACAEVKIRRDRFFEVLREKSLLPDWFPGAPGQKHGVDQG